MEGVVYVERILMRIMGDFLWNILYNERDEIGIGRLNIVDIEVVHWFWVVKSKINNSLCLQRSKMYDFR